METYFVRHTSVDVPSGICYGQTDVPLCATFPEEADKVLTQLNDLKLETAYTSPLSRCVSLASYCGYEAIPDQRLMELNFGRWEMQPYSSFQGKEAEAWFEDWIYTRTPDGESFIDQYRRVALFLDELRTKPFHNVIIFTHGGVITCANVYMRKYEMKEAFKHIPDYGEIVKFTL